MSRRRLWLSALIALSCLVFLFLSRERHGAQPGAPSVTAPRARPSRIALPRALGTRALTGRVQSASGAPIAAARVCAIDTVHFSDAERVLCAESDPHGRYRLECKIPGTYRVAASARGFAPGQANAGRPIVIGHDDAATDFDVVLSDKGARLAGTVLDASGGAVASAHVRAAQDSGVIQAETNDAGEFELWLEPGNVTLSAQLTGYALTSMRVTAPALDVVLKLTPGSSLQGIVRNRSTGEPVADIHVQALTYGRFTPNAPWTTSDEHGEFTIRDLDQGVYRLVARGSEGQGQADGPFELSVADLMKDLTVWVDPGLQVSGRVVVEGSATACEEGFVVLAETSGRHAGLPSLLSPINAAGVVEFEGVAAGSYRVQVECTGHMLHAGPETIELADESLGELVWRVARGLGLTVKVVDAAQRPVPGMAVMMLHPPGRDGLRSSTVLTADARGECQVPSTLVPGAYTFETGIGVPASASIELRADEPKREVLLTVPASGSILVTAVSSTGRPLDQLVVAASAVEQSGRHTTRRKSLFSDAPMLGGTSAAAFAAMRRIAAGSMGQPLGDGRYRIGPLEPGSYEVTVDDFMNPSVPAAGSKGSTIEVSRHEVSLRVVLDRGGQLRGRVLDADGGPASDVWVSALHEARDVVFNQPSTSSSMQQRVLTDGDGEFELSGLDPKQRFNVSVERPYGPAALKRGVVAGAYLTFRLPSLGELSGTIVDGLTREHGSAAVQVVHAETGYGRTVPVARNGSWRIDRVLPGVLRILALVDDGRSAELELELAESERRSAVDLTLPAQPPSPELSAQNSVVRSPGEEERATESGPP